MRRTILPGLGILLAIGLAGRAIASIVPGLNHLMLAIGLGVLVGNTIGTPSWAQAGAQTHKLWLETGIVLMGASIAIDQVLAAGLDSLCWLWE